MFQNETPSSAIPLISALFLLPFLGAFEWGMIAYCPTYETPILEQLLIPGLFTGIVLFVLALQQICYQPKPTKFLKKEITQQWKQSCLFGFIPAIMILLLGSATNYFIDDSASHFPMAGNSLNAASNLSVIATAENDVTKFETLGHLVFAALQAGILEEFFFRIVLLSGILGLLLGLKTPRRSSFIASIIISSGLFAFAHDPSLISQFNETISFETLGLFLYRFGAGTYLATIYLSRGFGVAVGAHIFTISPSNPVVKH